MKNLLSDADYEQVLDCIQAIHRCRKLEEFPGHVLAELRKLVDCYLAGYNEVDLSRNRFVVVFEPPRPDIERHLYESFAGLMHEHPVISYFDKTSDGQALMISDFLTTEEYHQRALYRDCYRHVGVEDQLSFAVQISPGFMIGIALNRDQRSFTEQDRLRVNLVRPHLIQAYLELAEIAARREKEQDLYQSLYTQGLGFIAVTCRGAVLHATPGAFECLANYLPVPQSSGSVLPSRIKQWLYGAEGALPLEPLILTSEAKRLMVRCAPGADRRLLILSETELSPTRLDQYSLTTREREVLHWIAEGKSNSEIATILQMTSGTAKLHVERILEKLGVENRVTAALVFHGVAF